MHVFFVEHAVQEKANVDDWDNSEVHVAHCSDYHDLVALKPTVAPHLLWACEYHKNGNYYLE
jgi:hypothetical protein